MKNYNLPKAAIAIFEDYLLPAEWQAQSDYMYLASCCLSDGYTDASKYFFEKALEEHGHFKKLLDYVIGRGVEIDVPKTSQPEVEFTDLKSAILYRKNLETGLTIVYDKQARLMFEIDMSAWDLLMEFLRMQVCDVKECNEQWAKAEKYEDAEDQLELEQLLFGSKIEGPTEG